MEPGFENLCVQYFVIAKKHQLDNAWKPWLMLPIPFSAACHCIHS